MVNDAYRLTPRAHYLYCCDQRWWSYHLPAIRKSKFAGELLGHTDGEGKTEWLRSRGITPVMGVQRSGLGLTVMHNNMNSGAQVINLAYWRATRIILLGYNMQKIGNQQHFFGDHPKGFHHGRYQSFVKAFNQIAEDLKTAGIECINCTPKSALTQFPVARLEDVL